MAYDNISPCAAEALRSVRPVKINGIMTGITLLDESIIAVQNENLGSESAICTALMNRLRKFNYIPPSAEEVYATALMGEYHKALLKSEKEKNAD